MRGVATTPRPITASNVTESIRGRHALGRIFYIRLMFAYDGTGGGEGNRTLIFGQVLETDMLPLHQPPRKAAAPGFEPGTASSKPAILTD